MTSCETDNNEKSNIKAATWKRNEVSFPATNTSFCRFETKSLAENGAYGNFKPLATSDLNHAAHFTAGKQHKTVPVG